MESLHTAEFPCTFPTVCEDDESYCETILNKKNGKDIFIFFFLYI